MIRLDGVELRRGGARVLGDASLAIRRRWKVGVVGANGAGKSSLLALLLGELEPDRGEVELPAGIAVATVAQEAPGGDVPLIDYVVSGDPRIAAIRARLADAGARGDAAAEAAAHADLEAVHGYAAEAAASRVLRGLGFAPDDGPRRLGHPLRGLEDARRARPHPRHPLGPPPARRAHEPPRPRCGGLAGRLVAALRRDPAAHLPRPGVPRSRRGPRRLGHRRPDLPLHRELQRVRTAARRRDRALAPGRRPPAARACAGPGVRRPFPLQGEQGAAGPEPDQGAGADAGGGARSGGEALRLRVPRTRALAPAGGEAGGGVVRIRRPHRAARGVDDPGSRGPRGPARGERNGQVHPDARHRGAYRAGCRCGRVLARCEGRVLRPAPARSARPAPHPAGAGAGRRARGAGAGDARLPRRVRFRGCAGDEPRRAAVRRREDPPRPRAAGPGASQPAPARRTHEPSRPRHA